MERGTKIVSLAILWLVPLLIFSLAFTTDWRSIWETLRVPTEGASFMDLRVITSGVKTQKQGGDPLNRNPVDHWQRRTNYPRIWLNLFMWLRIDDSNVRIVGVSFCALYLICISRLIANSASAVEALILLIAGLSLAPLFAIERGNTDLFVFSLMFLGCAATNKYLKPGAFFCAAMLKLFPFVGLMIDAIWQPRKESRVPLAFAGSALALLAWQWRDFNAIRCATPVSAYLSYGVLTIRAQEQEGYLSGSIYVAGWAIAILLAAILWLRRPKFEDSMLRSKAGEMFLIFGAIYAFTFVIGSNWNYRLIFLLPTIPFAIQMIGSTQYRKWGIAYIIAILLAENSFALGPYQGIPLGDIATFAVFAVILVILPGQAKNLLLRRIGVFQGTGRKGASPDSLIGIVG